MLSVILTILKIIGIILLVILGILLTVALIVLFVPVRYKSIGNFAKTDDGINDNVKVRVSWLLHIISMTFVLKDKDTEFVIKICGKKLSFGSKDNTKAKKKTSKKVQNNNLDDNKTTDVAVSKSVDTVSKQSSDSHEMAKSSENVTKTVVEVKAKEQITTDIQEDKIKDTKNEKKSLKEKLENIWNKINSICEKIRNIKDIKDSFVEYLKRDESKTAIKEIKYIILKVLKHILPQKVWARVRFGFEDPSTTGKILGIASILYGVYGDYLELEPDFENVVLEGEYKLKGRIRMFTLIRVALKVYRNKWLKEFIAFSKKTINKA